MYVGQTQTIEPGFIKSYPPGPPGFVAWMRDRMPEVYKEVKKQQPELVEEKRLVAAFIPKRQRLRTRRKYCKKHGGLDYEGYNYDTGNYLLWGLGQEPEPVKEKSTFDTWADRITSLATPLLSVYQQKEMVDLQIERAKQGLPPLADDALAARVKVTTGFDQYVPWIIGGVGLLVAGKLMRLY